MRLAVICVIVLSVAIPTVDAQPPKPTKMLPILGEVFAVGDRTAFIIPAKTDEGMKTKPWVWYAPTLPNLPGKEEIWMFEKFRAGGVAIGGIDAGESYGSPNGNKHFSAFHAEMVARGYSSKPVLLGRSRGGLMTLSWAAANPDKVAAFAGIYPVCNLASYPGIPKAAGAFDLTAEKLQERLTEFNPVDRLKPLAKARVPLFAIHGDIDKLVPLEANSGLMKERYTSLGGPMTLIVPPMQGHNMWSGFFQSRELVDFVLAHSGIGLVLDSPQDFQIVQRTRANTGTIRIRGSSHSMPDVATAVEYRLNLEGRPSTWQALPAKLVEGKFETSVEAPAGGWYRLEVRSRRNDIVLATSIVEHVGIGEVFVVAGQSNSANHGGEKLTTETKLVANFDGNIWQTANDPQPGASGNGGSFIPPFGDAIAQKFRVPVGIISCGIGATSVREWLPKGTTFPNPPTIESRVTKRSDGNWESKGDVYSSFRDRMKQLGPHGFRAVLWHQGESDANQKDATRTLSGKLYREYLEKLIRDSRRDIGWEAPWVVAQVSYHAPGDESSPDIRNAQASLWKDKIALEGPDSDALRSEFRDNGGKGVHFSGKGLRELANRWVEKVGPWLNSQMPGQ